MARRGSALYRGGASQDGTGRMTRPMVAGWIRTAAPALWVLLTALPRPAGAKDATTTAPAGVAPTDRTPSSNAITARAAAAPIAIAVAPAAGFSATVTSPRPVRRAGPAGSLLIVEPSHALPLIHVVAAL